MLIWFKLNANDNTCLIVNMDIVLISNVNSAANRNVNSCLLEMFIMEFKLQDYSSSKLKC